MRSYRSFLAGGLAAVVMFAGVTASGQVPRASHPVSGSYLITFNLTLASSLPANTPVVCKAAITPLVQEQGVGVSLPVESAASLAVVSGGQGTCTVEIPFAWNLPTASPGAALSFEIDGLSAAGPVPVLLRSSRQQGIQQPYPSPGGAAMVQFNLTF